MLGKFNCYDVVIVGSGLSGQAAAAEAAGKNLKTLFKNFGSRKR